MVTIVILLILAGVTLNIALSDNGLFSKTKQAAEEYEKAEDEEQRQIAMAEAAMNLNGTEYKSIYNGKELTVPIPAGFVVSRVEGENTVEDGLVIIDSEGNEFVWIPVNQNEYEIDTSFDNNLDNDEIENINGYLPEGIKDAEGSSDEEIEKTLITKEGICGFYVSRYEAGDESVSEARKKDSVGGTLVSKKGVYPYNWVMQQEANVIAKEFINNDSVKSGLITGRQWDMVMKFIESRSKTDVFGNLYDVRKFNESRHNGDVRTGGNLADFVCNIYNLEGNVFEWTTEVVKQPIDDSGYRMIFRGGCNGYDNTAFRSASYRTCNNYGFEWHAIGFRFVLYVIKN